MDILKTIEQGGVVGCGGAGFPTHVKWRGKADYFIVNGMECEPLLRTDRCLMEHEAQKVVRGARIAGEQLKAETIVIALKETYEKEYEALKAAKDELGVPLEIRKVKNFYPAGDEQILVYEITGRVVPPSGLPHDVGVVVSNVATVCAAYDTLEGIPFTHKYLTVTGEVEKPLVLKAPVGMPIPACIAAAKPKDTNYFGVIGGPMMGKYYTQERLQCEAVTKTTSGIIVLGKENWTAKQTEIPIDRILKRARSVCIQCSSCTDACPRHLLGHPLNPYKIMRKLAFCGGSLDDILGDEDVKQAAICSECGVCEVFACPMGLQPRKINQMLKQILRKEGIIYERKKEDCIPDKMRPYRYVPSKRLAARLEVLPYYDIHIEKPVEVECGHVEIPLKQHVGEPASPVVKKGQEVQTGQLIAACGENVLGARIHASISGTVTLIADKIVIER